ncbi:hypothetical protein DAPPUDRAFT_315943 [Daphnia pulex]|uniref:Uncharacterized protein n=1 Tax=Daphnia pulex TaxID=6669 RepID=E9GC38_DAPPU|nr:hypothetical protein DAPPUDRAFT_315943 [Daphnia pulex]|eukprot:EFX83209.1 hypothetical protein DAPPUDRAFT_315943 [Daphnia pulex]
MTDSTMDIVAEAANSPLDIECTEKDTKWDELLAPAPMGIAVLSQLMICTSHVTDFKIDNIKEDKISLLKHPSSFRTTLVQIVNEAYNAFMKAHTNMEKIKLQVSQVPDYVKDCVKIIKSDNKVAIEKFVPRRLECIKNAADNGEKLSAEVAQAFDSLGQLIQQVLLAIAASQGAKEQEIQDAIKANIAEKKRRQEQELERQKKYLQKEEDDNQKLKNKGEDFVLEERKRSRHALELIFFSGEKKKKLEKIQTTIQAALKRLEETKKKAKKNEEEMGKIENEYIKSLENMHIDVKKDISTDQMIQILKDGTQQLGKLQENWTGMTLYFKSINSYIEDMKSKQNMFVEDAEGAQDSSLIDFMAESIKKSLESSIKSHRTAAMYVQVSNNYIIEPLQVMHGMLAIEPTKMEQAQKELIESCRKASEGIKIMFNEDREQTIREIENALQSSDTVQSIEN